MLIKENTYRKFWELFNFGFMCTSFTFALFLLFTLKKIQG